ncbi:MAG TPA: NUDIX hydrolase [Nitrososphaeraceae archaeon]|nr:NUDIX hydrolase [Nitrososphaeraceae archaeon]
MIILLASDTIRDMGKNITELEMQQTNKQKIRSLSTKKVYRGDISMRIDRFELGKKVVEKEIVEHPLSVGIIPVLDNYNLIFVTQYRHAIEKTVLEIPAGKIEKGETPKQAAHREMSEEIGYTGTLAPLLRWYLAPGYSTEVMQIFIATNLKKLRERRNLDEDENITIKRMKLITAVQKCISGDIEDCKTVAAVLTYARLSRSKYYLKIS